MSEEKSVIGEWVSTATGRYRQVGDTIHWEVQKSLSLEDIKICYRLMLKMAIHHKPVFLISVVMGSTILPPEIRRYLADWYKEHPGVVGGIAAVGGTFLERTISQLVANAIQITTKAMPPLGFLKTEAEAIEWINKRRQAFRLHLEPTDNQLR